MQVWPVRHFFSQIRTLRGSHGQADAAWTSCHARSLYRVPPSPPPSTFHPVLSQHGIFRRFHGIGGHVPCHWACSRRSPC